MNKKMIWVVEIDKEQLSLYEHRKDQWYRLRVEGITINNFEDISSIYEQIIDILGNLIKSYNSKRIKIIWVIQPLQSIRKELIYKGLSEKELKNVLINEAHFHLHLEESVDINYKYFVQDTNTDIKHVLISGITTDVAQVFHKMSRELGVKQYEIIERCDILASMFYADHPKGSQFVADVDHGWLFVFSRGVCLSSEKIGTERITAEILKKVHYHTSTHLDEINICLMGDEEVCRNYREYFNEVLQYIACCIPCTEGLFLDKTLKYTTLHLPNLRKRRLALLKYHNISLKITFSIMLVLCIYNIYLKTRILEHKVTYQSIYHQYTQIQQQDSLGDTKNWLEMRMIDMLFSSLDDYNQLLHLYWDNSYVEWRMLNRSINEWGYIMTIEQLFPEYCIEIKDSNQGYQIYWMSMEK